MKTAGVICEYNPFHNGHEYMLGEMRKRGVTHIVACMSGSFCQRGEAAVYDKYIRTRAALNGGADLVIELPVSFACAGAERFALGGVYLLNSLGCTDELYFGSECGKTELLASLAEGLENEGIKKELHKGLDEGLTFAAARQRAVGAVMGEKAAEALSEPNNTLAVEYIRAIRKTGSGMMPCTVRRRGASHDGNEVSEGFAGAKYIRERINAGESIRELVPEKAFEIYSASEFPPSTGGRMKKLEPMIMYRLRMMDEKMYASLPDISEGLENRIMSAVRASADLEELIGRIKTKRYTRARINRLLMYALLGISRNDLSEAPSYIHVLGFNKRGSEVLKIAKKTASVPVIMKYGDIRACSENIKREFMLESRADDIFALTSAPPGICGQLMSHKIEIL